MPYSLFRPTNGETCMDIPFQGQRLHWTANAKHMVQLSENRIGSHCVALVHEATYLPLTEFQSHFSARIGRCPAR